MRINTNVSALNAQRQLGITNAAVSNSITKLSSGFRINRAADDAAGLGIANKLRGDIRSMTQAARNGEQANSLAQIAEGAVSGIASMLDRMKELATQANSDTVDTAGRERLQAEFAALRSEIGRTAATTQFGSTKLINGGFGSSVTAGGATAVAGVHEITSSGAAAGTYTITQVAASGEITLTDDDGIAQTLSFSATTKQTLNFSQFGITIETTAAIADAATNAAVITVGAASGGSFMVGSSGAYSSGSGDLLTFSAIDMKTATLGIDDANLAQAPDATDAAQDTLVDLDAAIAKVNAALGTLGAFQNRVENAVANLKVGIENLSASESVIRDLDMAAEMTNFSKNQILAQAGTAMLAQANASSQNILQLLRG